ncbi:unnamed protein product, partial [marine sediment metagenome]
MAVSGSLTGFGRAALVNDHWLLGSCFLECTQKALPISYPLKEAGFPAIYPV